MQPGMTGAMGKDGGTQVSITFSLMTHRLQRKGVLDIR